MTQAGQSRPGALIDPSQVGPEFGLLDVRKSLSSKEASGLEWVDRKVVAGPLLPVRLGGLMYGSRAGGAGPR